MGSVVAFPDPRTVEEAVLQMAVPYRYEFASAEELAGYVRALDDLPADKVVRGCLEAVKHERYFPRPSVLREHVKTLGREEQAPQRFTMPEVWTNPETGRVEPLFSCRDCHDTGWQRAGAPQREGIDPEILAQYTSVRRCACKTGGAA